MKWRSSSRSDDQSYSCAPDTGDYVSVGSYPFVLRLAVPRDLDKVVALVREAAAWLRSTGIDQWQEPWPDPAGHRERILNDLFKGKTSLVRDGKVTVATITIDTDEPLDADEHLVWRTEESQLPVLYVRRMIVSRRYARLGLGAALLDWATDVAKRAHGAELIRIDVRTTNLKLHSYFEGQRFTRCPDPQGLGDYPSQALFERGVDVRRVDSTRLFITEEGHDGHTSPLEPAPIPT
jgi:GNAT superfamily N-acetyltransferase